MRSRAHAAGGAGRAGRRSAALGNVVSHGFLSSLERNVVRLDLVGREAAVVARSAALWPGVEQQHRRGDDLGPVPLLPIRTIPGAGLEPSLDEDLAALGD